MTDATNLLPPIQLAPHISSSSPLRVDQPPSSLSPRVTSRLTMRAVASPEPRFSQPSLLNSSTAKPLTSRPLPSTSALLAARSSTSTAKPAPLSPDLITSDKAKIKFERKLQKILADGGEAQSLSSPRPAKLDTTTETPTKSKVIVANSDPKPRHLTSSTGTPIRQPLVTSPQTREARSRQRRTNNKPNTKPNTVPTSDDVVAESFNIRRKIEQFRKWHEEQYNDDLKKLNIDTQIPEAPSQEKSQENLSKQPQVDYSKILEDNILQSRTAERVVQSKAESRPASAVTWKTWRDVNQSDAYTDVQKYIQDNELMDEEKHKHIEAWLGEVRQAMEEGLT